MPKPIRKELKIKVAKPKSKKIKKPPKKAKKEVPEEKLPLWSFPLQGRSVRARNLAEAIKKVNAKE